MELNGRRSDILSILLKEESGISVKELSEQFHITKRMVEYDIEEINWWLKAEDLGRIHTVRGITCLQSEKKEKLQWEKSVNNSYRHSVEERRATEYLYILIAAEKFTSEDIKEIFQISVSTVFYDMKKLKEYLAEIGLYLDYSDKSGYQVRGGEAEIRKLAGKCYEVLLTEGARKTLYMLIQDSLEQIFGDEINCFTAVFQFIRDYEEKVNTKIVTSDISYLVVMLLISYIRNLKGSVLEYHNSFYNKLACTREFKAVYSFVTASKKSDMPFDESEICYITSLFLGVKNYDRTIPELSDSNVLELTENLLCNFERISGVTLLKDQYLINRLYLHMRPMLFRIHNGSTVENGILSNIEKMYGNEFFFTKEAVKATFGDIAERIPDEEVAYICSYIACFTSTINKSQDIHFLKILFLCDKGVAETILLKRQLSDLIGNIFSSDVAPVSSLSEKVLSQYDLVITTTSVKEEKNVISLTGPHLTDKDSIKILLRILEVIGDGSVHTLMEIIKKNTVVQNEKQLYIELIQKFYCIRRLRDGRENEGSDHGRNRESSGQRTGNSFTKAQ